MKSLQHRKVQGDASETGVVRFVEGVLKGQQSSLETERERYPVHSYADAVTGGEVECMIPFSSEIKFNLVVRDMDD